MKISVIIAAYNAEKYLEETLESVTHQSIDDYEIIIINDGSTDSTLDILTRYQKNYSNIRVIDKENGGPSSARNAGLDIAQGEYVFFFDADDLLEPEALEKLYDRAIEQQADVVIAKYDIFDRYKTTKVKNINDLVKLDEIGKYNTAILWTFSLWNKLYRRSLIEQYHFRFAPISYSEDGAFSMRFIYHASKITGLNAVVCHYRRMYDGETESITASVSPWKISHYITAHRMILEDAEESILRDYPQYSSIEEVRKENREMHMYLNEIIRKELQVLLNQFYIKFWDLEEDSVRLIAREVEEKLGMLDPRAVFLLVDAHPDVSLFQLAVRREDVLENAYFTAVLYGDETNQEEFVNCLKSLLGQNLVSLKIIVPLSMRTVIEDAEMMQGNVLFADAASENELFYYALRTASTRYITFCDPKIVYANNAFKYMFKRFIKSPVDFFAQLIYHRNYGVPQSLYYNRIALDSLTKGLEYNPCLYLDYTLANKFFRVDFLRDQRLDEGKGILSQLEMLYRTGYYAFHNDGIVIYEDTENSFLEFVCSPEHRSYIEEYFGNHPITLNSPEIVSNPVEYLPKLKGLAAKKPMERLKRKTMVLLRKLPVKNQVLFFSIRKDGELEGNAKALYPYVNGKKVICAKQLPHDWFTEIKMFREIVTSKVIVTDDYVRYLRHFPLRSEQRVIQLWHACGAFKKFGQRGTNLSIGIDMATHAQYNLASVSGEYIRTIYADAFNIDIKKVRALGSPRTDDFFNQPLIEGIRQKIYDKHPDLKDKFVIIYAPTFREIKNDRTQFHPELDFDRLSGELLPNQELLICPHPIMKNDILPKEYPNIRVMRDFSTNDLMFISDMLITDYSSVIFEYVLLKKPIAFYCYDLTTYNRGFYLNYPDDLPGNVYQTQDELTDYLRSPEKQVIGERYNLFIERYMSACDGHSCERIAKLINDYMEGN
ncbi:MAG: CDP-glycerol glycerophosphotransferase family protein [Eubacteriales bacterium]|nr:CDP-glycerol glycerophosphotransferase family protein [Eubacteriales bacterium]